MHLRFNMFAPPPADGHLPTMTAVSIVGRTHIEDGYDGYSGGKAVHNHTTRENGSKQEEVHRSHT